LAAVGSGYSWRSSSSSLSSFGSGQAKPARRARWMHSPAAVALSPRLAAIWRLEFAGVDRNCRRKWRARVHLLNPRSLWQAGASAGHRGHDGCADLALWLVQADDRASVEQPSRAA